MNNNLAYCESLTAYKRCPTREVSVGDIPLGGKNPIRIQSMTTTDTMNTTATVEQTLRMVNAGCEYVRITAPSINEAKNLENIKNELKKRGCNVPLIADIHFTPNAAEVAARIVEKVRVNPGNYADKKKFNQIEYTDAEYTQELEKIRERFSPLVKICKEYGTAMRIGTNHGSLSDRIMSRFGDSPLGMVESALEFVRICEELNYYNIVLSMKSSNPQVMVQAYRLLINKMISAGMNYPLHLGVTEAGDGEDGRIKSAVGIGTLLEDGIGDTVRVSLTEPPECEAPVAIALVNRYKERKNSKEILDLKEPVKNPFIYERRETLETASIGGTTVPKVTADLSSCSSINKSDLASIGYTYNAELDKWKIGDMSADILFAGKNILTFDAPAGLKIIYDFDIWKNLKDKTAGFPLFTAEQYIQTKEKSFVVNFVKTDIDDLQQEYFQKIQNDNKVVFVLETENENGTAEQRRIFFELFKRKIKNPAIVKRSYRNISDELLRLYSSTDFGSLLIEGFSDGVWIDASNIQTEKNLFNFINRTIFGILQAVRARISKTEYIACPSCGRTQFDLVEVTNKIRKRTEHLKGVKIGIMGCIVNGPGEMADADFGYVGAGAGKITLYKGKTVVKRNLNSDSAVDELILLIQKSGMWIDKD
jgi:(E)-4-hydroxy-3-methylbut-2-enyl-diphosphate synthase